MNVNDLLSKYTFHDSLVEKIDYNKSKEELIISIDFCLWMQDGYTDSQPETSTKELIFSDVYEYNSLSGSIDSFSILDTKYENDKLIISLLDDFHDEYHEIVIPSKNVIMK